MKFTKHIHVLHLLSQIPAPKMERVGNALWASNVAMTQEQAAEAWDHMFTYIHAHFPVPLTSCAPYDAQFTVAEKNEVLDCREMLQMNATEFMDKLATLPPYFTDVIFPVAIGRYMIRDLAMPINHRKLTTFQEFHKRYSTMILA